MAEAVLAGHAGVAAAAVIGVPATAAPATPVPGTGQAVAAFVVREHGTGVTAAELRELVAGELGEPAAPRDVRFLDELPMTYADKADKRALRAQYHGK